MRPNAVDAAVSPSPRAANRSTAKAASSWYHAKARPIPTKRYWNCRVRARPATQPSTSSVVAPDGSTHGGRRQITPAARNATAVALRITRNPRRTPNSAMARCQIGGRMKSPSPLPTKISPVAAPRRFSNHRGTTEATTTNCVPRASPSTAKTTSRPRYPSTT